MSQTTYLLGTTGSRRHEKWQFPANPTSLELLLRRYYVTPQRVTAIAEGSENQTFVVECRRAKYVLRVYRSKRKTVRDIMTEVDFMEFLHARKIPVPQIIRNARGSYVTEVIIGGTKWHAILMTHMPGNHPTGNSKEMLGQLARLQARMHLLGQQYGMSLERADTTRQKADDPRLPRGFCHLDLTSFNLLVSHGGRISAVLDFDDLAYRPLVDCLSTTMLRTPRLMAQPELATYYLTEYEKVRPMTRREKIRLQTRLVFRGRILARLKRTRRP